MSGAAAGDRAFEASNAGDINGDGFGYILIGARNRDPGGLSNAGQGYLIFGAANGLTAHIDLSALDATQGLRIDGERRVTCLACLSAEQAILTAIALTTFC